MLIPDQRIEVKLNGNNVKYYKELGYDIPLKKSKCNDNNMVIDLGKSIIVKLEDLPHGSNAKVDVQCDVCGKVIKRRYNAYYELHTFGLDCCDNCGHEKVKKVNSDKYGEEYSKKLEDTISKRENTNIKNFGVKYPSQNEDIKQKTKNTNLERYGFEHPLQSKNVIEKLQNTVFERYGCFNVSQDIDIHNKIIDTMIQRYGVKYYAQSDEGKQKIKETCLEKYGVESISQYQPIKDKIIKTNIKRYGTKSVLQNNLIKSKIKKTNLDKYGVENVMQSNFVKNKIKETMIKKYGVEHNSQSEEIKEKKRKTCINHFGVEYSLSSPLIREKINQTLINNGTCKTSSQQIKLHNMIQEKYPNSILNYSCGNSIFDIALILECNNIKIDIEYDGWYWHQNQEKDKRRDYYHSRRGWKILRIKSAMKLPSKEELFEAIDYLINTDHHYKEIILDDWKLEDSKIETA